MASGKKYLRYLTDPTTASVPRSTRYRRFTKPSDHDMHDEELQETCNDDATSSSDNSDNFSYDTPCCKNLCNAYEEMFSFQQMITDDSISEEDNGIEFEDLVNFCDLQSEKIRLTELENDSSIEFEDGYNSGEDLHNLVNDGASVTFHELAVLLMTLKMAFNLSTIALNFILKIILLILPVGRRGVIKNVKQLYEFFHSQDLSMKKHYYCGKCEFYIGCEQKECPVCKEDIHAGKYFVEIPLEEELQKVMKRNWEHLQYRFNRADSDTNNISDVYDGELYRKHFMDGGFLHQKNNISLLGNTDGVSVFKSSSFSVWPVYVVINELPPKLRFRRENRILAGLWIGQSKPNFSTFFKPFTEVVWKLCSEGFTVTIQEETQVCKAILLQMTCDTPAKCLFQGFMQFNAYHGCPYCLHPGEYNRDGRSHIYPYRHDYENGFGESRTHEGTVEHARIARSNMKEGKKKFAEKGVKGMSWAFSLPAFNIIDSMCLDYMHAVLLGVMKSLISSWCGSGEPFSMSKKSYEAVQSKLLKIPPPNTITRAPRALDERKHWKASEYRSFLLYYGPVCLYENLEQTYFDHFMLLSSAVWLMLQERISPDDLKEATRHLRYFAYQMDALYGSKAMTFSVHLLLHLPQSVMNNGPLWSHSCFFFEDYNGELRQFFHSSQHPDLQVVRAVSILQKLPEMVANMDSNSPAGILQKQMSADRYKAKCLTEFGAGLALVGKVTKEPPSQPLLSAISISIDPFFEGDVEIYKRALIKGQIFHSVAYTKVTHRNSYTVEYNCNQFGEILYYIVLGDSAYGFVHPFEPTSKTFCKDNLTGKLGKHLTAVSCVDRDPILVPLKDIMQKCIIMQTGQESVIIRFPNFIERD